MSAEICGARAEFAFAIYPTWAMKTPTAILKALAGDAFREFIPSGLEYFRSPTLDLMLDPNGLALRGTEKTTPRAHGLIAERLARTEVLQTTDPKAQVLERRIKDVWKVFSSNPAHEGSAILLARVEEIAAEIIDLPVPYADWQTLYRETLQLARALRGESQLLSKDTPKEIPMESKSKETAASQPGMSLPLEQMPFAELIGSITDRARLLVEKEVDLARTEFKADLKSELTMAKGLVGAVALLVGFNLLLVSLVLVLAEHMAPWLAALVVAAPFIVLAFAAALVGWSKRVKSPLEVTRATVKESVEWAKNRLA